MQEIISQIFLVANFKTLKSCHLVCRQWCRIATEFLFSRVVHHREKSKFFNEILARDDLSRFIKIISFGRAAPSDTNRDLVSSILSHEALRPLIKRPTVGVIRQRRQGEFIATLTGMGTQDTPTILPALEEIQFISNEEPYLPIALFSELGKLYIDLEYIRLPDNFVWPSLVDVHIRGAIDFDCLQAFLRNHDHIRQLHLAIVVTLRPLDTSSTIQRLLRMILNDELDAVAESIVRNAEQNADGHERSLLRHIHAQLDQMVDGSARKMYHAVVTGFEAYLQYEFQRHCIDLGNMRMPLQTLNQLDVSCSIAWFWEDELAIKDMKLPENYASRSGLWINDEVKESLGKSCVFKRTG